MSRFFITSIILLTFVVSCPAQEKKPAVKVIELPKLTAKIARDKLEPIWKGHNCNDPEIFYIINYGARAEVKRRSEIVADSIGLTCDIIGFRALYVDASRKSQKPLTVIWRTWPGGETPEP